MVTSRVDIWSIFSGHVRTLTDMRTGKIRTSDIFIFYGLPLVLSLLLNRYFTAGLLIDQSTNLLTAVSIIGGFLFALFAYIVGVIDRLKEKRIDDVVQKRFSREIHTNIAYSILISLLCICLLLGTGFLKKAPQDWEINGRTMYLVILYFLLLHFLLTLWLVVRRVYIVVDSQTK